MKATAWPLREGVDIVCTPAYRAPIDPSHAPARARRSRALLTTSEQKGTLMANTHDERLKGYIVIALTASTGKKYEDCKAIPQGDIYPAIYSQVFGPASQKDCEKWVAANCGKAKI